MTPRTIVALIAVLLAAAVVAVSLRLIESPTGSDLTVERKGLPSDATIAPTEVGAAEFINNYSPLEGNEQRGIGNLVIALEDSARFPLIDQQVQIRGTWYEADEAMALTDHRGEAAFDGVVEGAYLYTVSAAGRPLLVASDPVYVKQGDTTRLTLQIRDHDRAIRGWVLDRQGDPVAGLEITAEARRLAVDTGAPELRRNTAASARADADGRFEITGLRAGEYVIRAEPSDHYGTASLTVRAGVNSAVLTVAEKQMRVIEGTVTSVNGERLAGVKVMPPPGSSPAVFTDRRGFYSLTFDNGSGIGRRYLRFLLDGYQETRLELETTNNLNEPVTLVDTTLAPIGTTVTVSGRITDEYGQAVAGERVQFHSPSRYTTYRTTSDPNGNFSIDSVAASEDYRVWVRPRDQYGDYSQAAVALTSDQPYFDIVLPMLVTGTVRGRVLNGQRSPVADFNLWLRSASAKARAFEVQTDESGSFVVDQVPAGLLTLGTRSMPQLQIKDISLAAGAVQHIEVVLDEADAKTIDLSLKR